MAFAMDARCGCIEQDANALALDQCLEQVGGGGIELALHQPVHQVQQRHRRSGLGEAVSRFESEQTTADHDDALPGGRERQQQVDVAGIAEGVHAGEIGAGHVEPQRRRADGEHELGIFHALFAFDLELASAGVDLGDAIAVAHRDAAMAPPVGGSELDLVRAGLAGQHGGEQNAVVSEPRLFADHGDRVAAECGLGELVDQTRGRHTVSDDDQRFTHNASPIQRPATVRRRPRTSCSRTTRRRRRSRR